jgi:IclR family transcriptional regulator, KDG regulon repressor
MIQSLDRAFKILELMNTLECARKGLGGLEISKQLGLKHPTVHNFLKSLTELGYIQQDPDTSKFRLADKAQELGMNMIHNESLLLCAKPHLKALTEKIGETSLLILLDNDHRHTVLIEECNKPYRITATSTIDQNFYGTSTGRILLANMTKAELKKFQKRVPINFSQSYAPENEEELAEIINDIQSKAYEYIVKGEVTVIGVPLVNKSSGLNASIGIYFHSNSKTQEEIEKIVKEMQKTSVDISKILKIH